MKKNFVYALMAVSLLSGCSNNLDEPVNGNYPGLDEEGNEPVEIKLGTVSPELTVTRASVTSADWVNSKVGILALAKNAGANFTNATGCLLNTVGTIGGGSGNPLSLGNIHYYPLGNDNNYSFYGYYPVTIGGTAITPVVTANQVTCSYTIDGTQDVLVARAAVDNKLVVDANSYDGYNARYFRKGGETPNLTFKHLLSKLTFNIVAGVNSEGSTDAAKKIRVNSIKIIGVENSATLTFPFAKDGENGALAFVAGVTSDFTLKETQGDEEVDASPVHPADAVDKVGVMMGNGIMLPAGKTTYSMLIEVQDEASNKVLSPLTVTIPGGQSVAGTSYRVNMTINGLEEVKLTTTLTDWVTGADIDLEL